MTTVTTPSTWRIELACLDATFDGEARHLEADLAAAGAAGVRLQTRPQYLVEGELTAEDAARLARELLADSVTQRATVATAAEPANADAGERWYVVHRRPGVMDPVAQSVMRGATELGLTLTAVRTARKVVVVDADGIDPATLSRVARRVLANDVIEEVFEHDPAFTTLSSQAKARQDRVELDGFRALNKDGRARVNAERKLSMTDEELTTVQQYFIDEGRDPTDVEVETLAQTWSEHCKHKTLTGLIDYVELAPDGSELGREEIDNLLKSTIAKVTTELDRPWCWSVFVDNAGVIALTDDQGVCIKVETHNHPSALEPYGGAGTGIGGVIRDIMGTGLGARPIFNTDVFCFGLPDTPLDALPKGTLHPRRVMHGVVAGVRDYGNRMGIPTINGAVYFHDNYIGNPLVYCGCIGVIPKRFVNKAARAGDKIVVAGGRTGRDGIGGATFSSAELTDESESISSGAVQIGNAIEEKRTLDVMLQARDRGLYTAVTDCGAGGLSSACGEMGEETGVDVELARVPLKYAGLTYREIWLSEAQERMVFSVPPEHVDAFVALFASEDVDATVIGTFTGDHRLRLTIDGNEVANMDMGFVHHGLPRPLRKATWTVRLPGTTDETQVLPADSDIGDLGADLLAILRSPNVCSKEWIIRQYDHEVQGASVVKPLVGVRDDGPSDAAVVAPLPGSARGVVISCGFNPEYGLIDPYHMAAAAIDEAVRNNLATGGTLSRMALLDNFSWGNCAKPDRLGGVVRASKACYDIASVYGTPFISGKDSLNNEFTDASGASIAVPPTLLITAMSVIDDVSRCITMDLKRAGTHLYLVGHTFAELGGSHWRKVRGLAMGWDVPVVRHFAAMHVYTFLEAAIAKGHVLSCHDCSEGGLAVTVAEMALAGGIGARLDVSRVDVLLEGPAAFRDYTEAQRDILRLYAESQTRFVVEVSAEQAPAFEALAKHDTVTITPLGSTQDTPRLQITSASRALINLPIDDLREAWQAPLRDG